MKMARETATAEKPNEFGQVTNVHFAVFYNWSTITVLTNLMEVIW